MSVTSSRQLENNDFPSQTSRRNSRFWIVFNEAMNPDKRIALALEIRHRNLSAAKRNDFVPLFCNKLMISKAQTLHRLRLHSDKVIERCMKDEYSLFRSRLCSNRDSNGEYESFVQSSITISIVQMVFLSRFAENRDRKHHPCDSNENQTSDMQFRPAQAQRRSKL